MYIYDGHDVRDIIFKAYDGLRLVTVVLGQSYLVFSDLITVSGQQTKYPSIMEDRSQGVGWVVGSEFGDRQKKAKTHCQGWGGFMSLTLACATRLSAIKRKRPKTANEKNGVSH